MENFPILSFLISLPIIAAIIIAFLPKNGEFALKFGFLIAIVNFIVSLKLIIDFDKAERFNFIEKISLITRYDINYHLGIDGMSLFLILLTTFLVPICFIISKNSIKELKKEYIICFLLIESFVIASFSALDLVLFYIFFEATLIPMFLIIGIWGGINRIYASYKFFIYTLFGSLFFLIAIIYLCNQFGTANILILEQKTQNLNLEITKYLFLAFFISFAIKIPMFPFHTWLPDAHVQAPTAGSVILAGVLIKLGAYGFLRFSLPFFPEASEYYANFIFILSVIAIIYTSIIAIKQEDIKKMIAYSSVAHMGFVTIGIFSLNDQGISGSIMQILSHGLISAALFIAIGMIYERTKTRQIKDYGGLVQKMPNYALFFMIFTLGSVGLPGTSGFVGEFLAIIGVFQVSMLFAALATIGVILGACYMLPLYSNVFYKDLSPKLENIKDLNKTEYIILFTLSFLVILFGIFPNLILSYI
ncbi:NADH-quinone oxidoreductase subunit M [Rickettsiales bacterium]|nr:NADH-quinone oxidoreductase subunit M [Rickettsiales bacterium]MDB2550255.1 NADH-quinone oxidoreductase subunit M [Rickettsiales bacterium]